MRRETGQVTVRLLYVPSPNMQVSIRRRLRHWRHNPSRRWANIVGLTALALLACGTAVLALLALRD
jgi:hypothetical protein